MSVDTTGATRSALDAILKDHYLGPIREQLNSETLLARRLERNQEDIDGRDVVIPLHTGRTRAIQAALEGGLLPEAQSQSHSTMRFRTMNNYLVIRVHGPTMAATRSGPGAFIRALDLEIRGGVRDVKHDINRQFWGDGSGRLAVVTGAAAGAVITCENVHDYAGQSAKLKHIYPGDLLAAEDISTAGCAALTGTSYLEVDSVDLKNKQVTMKSNVTLGLAAGDALVKGPDTTENVTNWADDSNFRGQNGGSARTKKEIMGLVGIVNGPNGWPVRGGGVGSYVPAWATSAAGAYAAAGSVYCGNNAGGHGAQEVLATLQGVQSSVEATIWQANVDFNSGVPRPLTLDLMQQMFDTCEEVGHPTPTIIITTYAGRREYLNLLTPDRRFIAAQGYELDGGFRAVDFNDVPIVVDKDCPEGAMFFLSEPNLAIYEMSDWHWLDKDNAILKWVSRRDAWEAVMAWYSELGTDRRNAHGVIGDIAVA